MDDNNNLMLETSGDDEENRELIDEKSNAEIQTENISEEISKEAETAPDEILERSDFDEGRLRARRMKAGPNYKKRTKRKRDFSKRRASL